MIVSIVDLQDRIKVEQSVLDVVRTCILATAQQFELSEDMEVSVGLVDDTEIAELNKTFRDKDAATDVLSFPLINFAKGVPCCTLMPYDLMLGDIVISCERAVAQSLEFNHSFEREMGFLTVHSMLHLLGYDHKTPPSENEMGQLCERILKAVGLTR